MLGKGNRLYRGSPPLPPEGTADSALICKAADFRYVPRSNAAEFRVSCPPDARKRRSEKSPSRMGKKLFPREKFSCITFCDVRIISYYIMPTILHQTILYPTISCRRCLCRGEQVVYILSKVHILYIILYYIILYYIHNI